jgi:hypothetical protein
LSYTANLFILMIFYDFCFFPAQFCYIIHTEDWKLFGSIITPTQAELLLIRMHELEHTREVKFSNLCWMLNILLDYSFSSPAADMRRGQYLNIRIWPPSSTACLVYATGVRLLFASWSLITENIVSKL